jgi:hypothetical protein
LPFTAVLGLSFLPVRGMLFAGGQILGHDDEPSRLVRQFCRTIVLPSFGHFFTRLKSMAREGWLNRDDLVWQPGLSDWLPAGQVPGLFAPSVGQLLQRAVTRRGDPSQSAQGIAQTQTSPPPLPEKTTKQTAKQPKVNQVTVKWHDLSPGHVVAACGGFIAALGIAFTAIAQSRVALAFTLAGFFIAAVILPAAPVSEGAQAPLAAAPLAHGDSPAGGNVVVINQPPVRLWSPGLAAVLSFFVPGLGQLYKGQFINGIVWFVFVGMGYVALILPGMILHFFCVLGALSGNPWTEGKTTVVRQ